VLVELAAPPGDRFVVREISGYSMGSGARWVTTSYSVYDLDYCCVVATFYSPLRVGGRRPKNEAEDRRRAAEARCRALNEQERRWLHSGRWVTA